MKIELPQLIFTAMTIFGAGICAARYGKPKTDHYDMVDCLIGPAITFALLYWGGFYGP